MDEDQRTVWCGNISSQVTEEVLYELFLQAAPLEKVHIPKDKDGKQNNYGFITFKHIESVNYTVDLLNGIMLYDKRINIKPRTANKPSVAQQSPVTNEYLFDQLIEMGNNLLPSHKLPNFSGDYNRLFNQNTMMASTPHKSFDQGNQRNNRYNDNRSYGRQRNYPNNQRSHPYKEHHKNRRHDREWRK